jgi:hypothetical protein
MVLTFRIVSLSAILGVEIPPSEPTQRSYHVDGYVRRQSKLGRSGRP